MYESHMAARVLAPTQDGMLRFGPPVHGIELCSSMSRNAWMQGRRARRPWREMDEDIMRSLFLFHDDEAVGCSPLSGLWNRVRTTRRVESPETVDKASEAVTEAQPIITPTTERTETLAIEDAVAPVSVLEKVDNDQAEDTIEEPTDQDRDIDRDQCVEAVVDARVVKDDVPIRDEEEWVVFSDDEAWVIGDSEDFEFYNTSRCVRSYTPPQGT
jgi:hypothetical protein